MPFDDAKLATHIGFLILQLWKVSAEKEDLLKRVQPPGQPGPQEESNETR